MALDNLIVHEEGGTGAEDLDVGVAPNVVNVPGNDYVAHLGTPDFDRTNNRLDPEGDNTWCAYDIGTAYSSIKLQYNYGNNGSTDAAAQGLMLFWHDGSITTTYDGIGIRFRPNKTVTQCRIVSVVAGTETVEADVADEDGFNGGSAETVISVEADGSENISANFNDGTTNVDLSAGPLSTPSPADPTNTHIAMLQVRTGTYWDEFKIFIETAGGGAGPTGAPLIAGF